jgi:hypothetical protein
MDMVSSFKIESNSENTNLTNMKKKKSSQHMLCVPLKIQNNHSGSLVKLLLLMNQIGLRMFFFY